MARLIEKPTHVAAQGNRPKLIDEYVGRVNTGTGAISIARMKSPPGWVEPGQQPEFDEYSLVLEGLLRVRTRERVLDVPAGSAVVVSRGEWVQYSTPSPEGAEYIAVCLPAFSPDIVHRDDSYQGVVFVHYRYCKHIVAGYHFCYFFLVRVWVDTHDVSGHHRF